MLTIQVCIGSSCHLKGAYNVVQTFQQMIEEHGLDESMLTFKGAFCMRQCAEEGVAVSLDKTVHHVKPEEAASFFRATVLPLARP